MNWLARLFSPRKSEAPPAVPAAVPAARNAPASAPTSGPDTPPADAGAFLPWLLQGPPLRPGPVSDTEQRALHALDKVLALPVLPDELLPRAAALIPQLLAMLRQSDLPVPALAQRVAKDVVLTAEVLRLASSPYYRAQAAVTDLQQAIALIGVAGLQAVIARVVLKPMFEAAPGPLSARAGARLWEHAEALAAHTAEQATAAGTQPFDGYLAGLLHGSGWTIALRALDRARLDLPMPCSESFALAAADRAHRLFGQAAQRWTITPAFSAFGTDARQRALAASRDPLAAALRAAQPAALAALSSEQPAP
ncbi:HDOD domain-containing protein [Rubrivivax sp. RP6-9]|uniref:HDOD domain-containing protein n=1 Tax=Rubrivivax sp. RP6-9 TaxID=3415750 RepID=UPI003CC68103